jgi:hypothetical protein
MCPKRAPTIQHAPTYRIPAEVACRAERIQSTRESSQGAQPLPKHVRCACPLPIRLCVSAGSDTSDAAGCGSVEILATPGWRDPSQMCSRQYEQRVLAAVSQSPGVCTPVLRGSSGWSPLISAAIVEVRTTVTADSGPAELRSM